MHVYPKRFRPANIPAILFRVYLFMAALSYNTLVSAQSEPPLPPGFIVVPATENYQQTKTYKKFWGENYRKEWGVPVPFKIVSLDTLAGGLTAYNIITDKQTTNLLLRDRQNREYILHSFSKQMSNALPPVVRGSMLEDVANDQITFTRPYASLVVSPLAKAAGVFHTNPELVFVPRQAGMEQFADSLQSSLFVFEQNPIGNWETAANFGYAKHIIGTDQMLKNLFSENHFQVNQLAFARARLLDILLGDWERNEDHWRWASFERDGEQVYEPIPIERDFAFSKPEGIFPKMLFAMIGAEHIQPYDYEIKKLPEFNFLAKNLDHLILNSVEFNEWVTIATDMQKRLSDTVIVAAIQSLPIEIQKISGATLAGKLKSRRDFLKYYAEKYYAFLAKTVNITGTADDEFFLITNHGTGETSVEIFRLIHGIRAEAPYYFRFFKPSETRELRLFGIGGSDHYQVTGTTANAIRIRMIGGANHDQYGIEKTGNKTGKPVFIYDNNDNQINTQIKNTKLRLSTDSSVHDFQYNHFKYDKSGVDKIVWYNNEDKLHVGVGYTSKKRHFRKQRWGMIQESNLKYSISQKAFSAYHQTTIYEAFGKWNWHLMGYYDQIRWINFHGLGNRSEITTKQKSFYRLRNRLLKLETGIARKMGQQSEMGINVNFQTIDFLRDTAGYFSKQPLAEDTGIFRKKKFLGAELLYVYQKYNDRILPTKGLRWETRMHIQQNLQDAHQGIVRMETEWTTYTPLTTSWGLKNKFGLAGILGSPEFYQLHTLGDDNLRGFNRERFYGRQMAYVQNEIRYIKNVHSYYYNGKLGVFMLYDLGRVWIPHQNSNRWHSGYGLGVIVSPFNQISFEVAAARSADYNFNLHVNVVKSF